MPISYHNVKSELFKFTLYVDPTAKKRVRVYRTSTGVRGVNPSADDEQVLKNLLVDTEGVPKEPLEGGLLLGMKFFKSPPKSTRKKDLELIPNEIYRPTVRPDLDNYIKLAKDAATGILWKDDNQIVGYLAGTGKYYTLDKPRIEFIVLTLGYDYSEIYLKLINEEITRIKELNKSAIDYFS